MISSRLWKYLLTSIIASVAMQTTMAQTNPLKSEAIYGQGNKSFKLATGSPGELGLLQAEHVYRAILQPLQNLRQTHFERIDVPGGEFH